MSRTPRPDSITDARQPRQERALWVEITSPKHGRYQPTTVLFDVTEPEIRLEVEVLAVDRDLREVPIELPTWVQGLVTVEEVTMPDTDRQLVRAFADKVAEQASVYIDNSGLANALNDLPVPTFGSPPVAFSHLGQLLKTVGPFVTGMVLAHEASPQMTMPFLLLYGTGMTVVVNIVQPVSGAFGDAVAYRIRRWGGLVGAEGSQPSEAEKADKEKEKEKGKGKAKGKKDKS